MQSQIVSNINLIFDKYR